MSRITVLGGTGFTGSAVVNAALARGHEVTSLSRNPPADPPTGVTYLIGSVLDEATLASAVAGADAIVVALAPRGELQEALPHAVTRVAEAARASGARLGVVGGAGTLLAAHGGPPLYETPDFPAAYVPDSRANDAVLRELRAADAGLDWFVLSPPLGFGPWAPGVARGTYRVGDDVLLTDDEGRSEISVADLAGAVLDALETAAPRRARFTVAY